MAYTAHISLLIAYSRRFLRGHLQSCTVVSYLTTGCVLCCVMCVLYIVCMVGISIPPLVSYVTNSTGTMTCSLFLYQGTSVAGM